MTLTNGGGIVNARGVPKVETSHDIGILTAAKLVGICWAGLIPVLLPAWLIIQGEIRYQNHVQDNEISSTYVSKAEFFALKESINDLKQEVRSLREAITGAQNGKAPK